MPALELRDRVPHAGKNWDNGRATLRLPDFAEPALSEATNQPVLAEIIELAATNATNRKRRPRLHRVTVNVVWAARSYSALASDRSILASVFADTPLKTDHLLSLRRRQP